MSPGDVVTHPQFGIGVVQPRTASTLPSYEYIEFVSGKRRVRRDKLEYVPATGAASDGQDNAASRS